MTHPNPLLGREGVRITPMNINKLAVETARILRKKSTKAEKVFWNIDRNRKLVGKKFNRQFPIVFDYNGGKRFFIADFYCHEAHLIVEIDGSIHEQQKDYDQLRTVVLYQLDLNVIRFSNNRILEDTEVVIHRLKKALSKSKKI
ncbi:MAG: endonuclease domain-containing protein [Candidatus Cloacimonadales bacterium]|nr:endonuclease domain-containing protein [Candidatus Cloacimonadales bacterium]